MSKVKSNDAAPRRRSLFGAGLAAAAASLPFAASADKEMKPMLMFVQTADDLKVDPVAQTVRTRESRSADPLFCRSARKDSRPYHNGGLPYGMDDKGRFRQFP